MIMNKPNIDRTATDRKSTNRPKMASRTRSIAFVGLSIALIAVSAWITIPLGPIPFTLQMLSISFLIYALRPTEAIAAIYGYVVLGAIGVPVFSGMRGGIGVIMGPTGGFIAGYLIGVPLAVGLLYVIRRLSEKRAANAQAVSADSPATAENAVFSSDGAGAVTAGKLGSSHEGSYRVHKTSFIGMIRNCGWGIVAGLIFVAVSYAIGTIQYTFVAHVGVEVALAACVIPFVVPDIIKVILGVACAQAVVSALGLRDKE